MFRSRNSAGQAPPGLAIQSPHTVSDKNFFNAVISQFEFLLPKGPERGRTIMTPGKARGKKSKYGIRAPKAAKLVAPPQFYGTGSFGAYHNVLLPSPPATPGVIMVTIPQSCGTGPFGSSINILPNPEVN
jgi:hypothetical protein